MKSYNKQKGYPTKLQEKVAQYLAQRIASLDLHQAQHKNPTIP